MEGLQLGPEEQQANVVYVQATGQQPPTNDDGPMPGSDQTSDGSNAPADDADAGGDQAASDQGVDQDDQTSADQGDADQDAVVDDSSASAEQTSGDFAGWQMPFTDPYGYLNMGAAPAWDSAYPYLPPDYEWPFYPPYWPY
jgi:hypothetical protein